MDHLNFSSLSKIFVFLFIFMYSSMGYSQEQSFFQNPLKVVQQQLEKMAPDMGQVKDDLVRQYNQSTTKTNNQYNGLSDNEIARLKQQQAQVNQQYRDDMKRAENDYDSKYTRMSKAELNRLANKGDRKAHAELMVRIRDGVREEIGSSNMEIVRWATRKMIVDEAVKQSIQLTSAEKEEVLFRVEQTVKQQGLQDENSVPQFVRTEVKNIKNRR